LPSGDGAACSGSACNASGERVPAPTLRLLLVEDSPDQAELVEDLLAGIVQYCFEVTVRHCLAGALACLEDGPFHVVLLDLRLPDAQGVCAVRRVRARDPDAAILVLTGFGDEGAGVASLREGAQDQLPLDRLDRATLLDAIRESVPRAQAEARLRASEQRHVRALEGANDGVWDWDLDTGRLHVSARWRAIADLEDAGSVDVEAWFARVHPEDLPALRSALDAHFAGKTPRFEQDHRLRTAGGEYRWVSARGLAVRDASGRARRIAGAMSEITRRKLAEEQLIHDALHDGLTKLPNRVLFIDRLSHAMRRHQRDPESRFAVLYFDLNRFKTINDTLGHAIGDELLIAVARRLETILRPGDTVARLGGDEFAVLLSDIRDAVHIATIADRIQEILGEVFIIRSHELYASASIGIAMSAPGYERPEELLRDADLAMYRAKSAGGAGYEIFDSAMHESVLALHRLEMDLRRAIEHGELVNHYQPIVSVESGRVTGFEALLRWHHPQWGLMTPEAFIDVAEETGLVIPIGWQVLENACRQTRSWQQLFPLDPPLSVSVNISGRVFLKKEFVERIEAIVRDCELPPRSLRLEITERTIMDHTEVVLESLARLRALGVQLYIDDFGTGYTSLTHLRCFGDDTLKIDRSFVADMVAPGSGNAIVKAIVALADSLNMNVIAEGVETGEQLAILRAMRCREAQGFHFSQPMDAERTSVFLKERLPEAS